MADGCWFERQERHEWAWEAFGDAEPFVKPPVASKPTAGPTAPSREKVGESYRLSAPLSEQVAAHGDGMFHASVLAGSDFVRRRTGAVLADPVAPSLTAVLGVLPMYEHADRALDTLIVASKAECPNWKTRVTKWLCKNPDFDHRTPMPTNRHRFRIVPWHELAARRRGLMHSYDVVIVDDAHLGKSASMPNPSQRGMALYGNPMLGVEGIKARKKICISTEPVASSPADVWSIGEWLCPGLFGDWHQYIDKYCRPGWRQQWQDPSVWYFDVKRLKDVTMYHVLQAHFRSNVLLRREPSKMKGAVDEIYGKGNFSLYYPRKGRTRLKKLIADEKEDVVVEALPKAA